MAEVVLKDIVKVYGRQVAVRGIDLEIADGSLVVFVGPSGCGKSTTLRMIAGLETISHGELIIGGKLANDLPSRERGVAMVFQTYALYPHMTVRENLAFSLKLAKLSKTEIDTRIDKAVAVLQLGPYLDRRPSQLSGGQRQRVAMGRAIVREPQVFLFDEPLSNLDAKLRNQMRVEIKRLQRHLGVTTIYVTHDQVEAMTLGDKIVVMKDGEIAQQGTTLQIFETPRSKFVAGFIGSPQMSFFEGTLVRRDGAWVVDCGPLHLPVSATDFGDALVEGRQVYAGLRAEDIVPEGHGMQPKHYVAVRGEVTLTEMLGNENLLFGTLAGLNFVSRMQQPRQVDLNETLSFHLNVARMHLFDRATEQNLKVA
ncbi:MAG: sn-glycerol-3-phosphate ABC transporter ATP-binding protein UgpC [Devosia sp.]|uniref:ABC transporter ATP-binding protein n=1 Tax=Devosia sp. TaxID=1871048 RepID=UPI001A07282D|nr:sn-glycerol-3-phosphate ABC transporter ATP-binding protein UgpC [Devosia sp.]MBF0678453.1 sn-glycerol-3-phosphate ABC transporter ATP-binding protein UgpC [Devosia sp.]